MLRHLTQAMQHPTRVMNAEDGLASSSELAQESDNAERRLAIETGRRLIKEKNANGHTLALPHGVASLRLANNGVCDIFHLQQADDFLNVRVLLFLWNIKWLS